MDDANTADSAQARLWNGLGGHAWVEERAVLDRMFKPFEELLVAEAAARPSRGPALDVGCGTGSTTLALARELAEHGGCTGIDLSAPMLAVARERAERAQVPARFVRADAQRHPLDSEGVGLVVSRFGVMFFDDPVAAFGNLRRAARDGAALRCIAWRGAEENPFMTLAERVAAPLLPGLPARDPGAPGQFAFADATRVRRILERSGWAGVDVEAVDVDCALPASDLPGYLARVGPVGVALNGVDGATRARVADALRDAFDPYVAQGDARFTAACWAIRARVGA